MQLGRNYKKTITMTQKRKFPWIRYVLLGIFLTPILLISYIGFSISDDQSSVLVEHSMDTDTAVNARNLALELRGLLKSPEEEVQLSLSEDDINSLIALLSRASSRIRGHVNILSVGMRGALSIHVPENILGSYINIHFGVEPSATGLSLTEVSIGGINLSGDTVIKLARFALNTLLKENTGDEVFNSIQSVRMDQDVVTVYFRPIRDMKMRLSHLGDLRDDMQLLGDPELIRQYYAKLCEIDQFYDHNLPISAMAYIVPLFAYAQERSFDAESAVKANHAAMLALGVHLGSYRFARLVGDIQSTSSIGCRTETVNVVFHGRRDLVQHFFISSAMKLLSDSELSFAVGEYKELLDTTSGGLSVSDIAGNVAGIRFAELVTEYPSRALATQRLIVDSTDESVLFPDIDGMPPKLPRKQFEAKYGHVNDPRYQAMLADINARIDRLPIYQ